MSNPNDDVREVVKENAHLYRETEQVRQNHEDLVHFLANNPQDKNTINVLDELIN